MTNLEDLENQKLLTRYELDNDDYKIIKCYEYFLINGEHLQEYDLSALHEKRQNLRSQINQIDLEIEKLKSQEEMK